MARALSGAATVAGIFIGWLQLRRLLRRRVHAAPHGWVWLDPRAFKAANPRWLTDALHEAPAAREAALLVCPLLETIDGIDQEPPEFGADARQQLFGLEREATYLNHGSYGATFKLASEVQAWFRARLESQPVRFMETAAVRGLLDAVTQVATLVHATPGDVIPVTNATTAVAAVLSNIRLRPRDVILVFNTTYPAVRSAAARTAAAHGAQLLEIQLGIDALAGPSARASIEGTLQHALAAVPPGRLKLVILDHISSFPPVVMPVARLTHLCRATHPGAHVLVDGAHAVGNLPDLDIPSIGADYYTSNLCAHKWCCTPKGTAFLWAHPSRQAGLLPLVTSHGYGLGFQGEWVWQGTADVTAWLAVPASLRIMQALGPHKVAGHNTSLVEEAARMLVQQLPRHGYSKVVGGTGRPGTAAGMLAVSLPPLTHRDFTPPSPDTAAALHDWLRAEHGIEVPVAAVADRLWVRLSAQIYNELRDYKLLVTVLQQLSDPIRESESSKLTTATAPN